MACCLASEEVMLAMHVDSRRRVLAASLMLALALALTAAGARLLV
jgi:hypothetical protein